MLKIIKLFNKLASSKNNKNMLVFEKNYSNNKVDRFDTYDKYIKYTKKLRKSKNKKLFKS